MIVQKAMALRRQRIVMPIIMVAAVSVILMGSVQYLFVASPAQQSSSLSTTQGKHLNLRTSSALAGAPSSFGAVNGGANPVTYGSAIRGFVADIEDKEASTGVMLAATALAAVAMRAAASEAQTADEASSGGLWSTIKLPIFAGLWYFFNVQYNLKNKMLLKVYTATWAVSFWQLAAGVAIAMTMWGLGLVRKPKLTGSDVGKLAPVGAAFAAGQVFTVASLGAVAVSFTHVVKALEPAINAIASALLLGQVFHPIVYASLLPIFAGVGLASSKELSFTMFGFGMAMASNFAFVLRNVLATKLGSVGDLGEDQTTRKTNQLAVLTVIALIALFPIALFLPGGLLSAKSAWDASIAAGTSVETLRNLFLSTGFYFYMYQLSSFWVLSCVQPITHSVLNTLKRCVIIVVSIMVFRNPVSPQSVAGTVLAVGGVLLYSLMKSKFSNKKK